MARRAFGEYTMRMMHNTLAILPLLLAGWLPSLAFGLDLGPVESLQFETLPGQFTLRGPDARMQVLVTGVHANGRLSDATRSVTFTSEPTGIVAVDATDHRHCERQDRSVRH
jgi:hypothetical protein